MKTKPEVMMALTRYIAERAYNISKLFAKGKVDKADLVLGDVVVGEAKLDALIMLLEDSGIDMSKLNDYMLESCKMGQASAISIRKQFEALNK